jgi:hypothetical protein
VRQAAGRQFRRSGDDHPTVAVAHQALELQNVHHIPHVRVQANAWIEEMRPLAQAGQRGGVDRVAGLTQPRVDLLPAPCSVPASMNEHERGHATSLPAHAAIPRSFFLTIPRAWLGLGPARRPRRA